jgi:DNA polymerase-3 subunit alpha
MFSFDSTSKIKKIVSRAKELGQTACALTDHGNMSGCVQFYLECKKQGIKPLLGMESYVCKEQKKAAQKDSSNKELNHLVLLAKNIKGYRNLLKLVYLSNQAEHSYYRPRIDEEMLFAHSEGLICLNGHHSTSLFDCLFFNLSAVHTCESIDETRNYLHEDYENRFLDVVSRYISVFGSDFYVECQLFDQDDILQQSAATILFELAKKHGIQATGTGDPHYINKKDALTHKLFVAIKQNCKINDLPNIRYFTHEQYYMFGQDVAELCYPQELIDSSQEIADKIEEYDITRPAAIPSYGQDADAQLRALCESNFGKLCPNTQEYKDRLEHELKVISGAGLSSYFLIVSDYIKWASERFLTGPGRGSSSGCLISYLCKITKIDPIKYGLLFERFYSSIRAEAKALPDIDTDFPATKRDSVVEYLKDKYGKDNVCSVVTFGTLQGKGALKDTLRSFNACDFKQMGEISDLIPSRDKISDKMAEFKEETGSDSIIYYMLKHDPETIKDYAYIDENENIVGPYGMYFEEAIKLEGAIKAESKHASAYIISDRPIYEVSPMIKDKNSSNLMCALDMNSFESVGLVKFDLLGLRALDGLMEVNKLLKEVKI